jgi:hypothetical protein
VKFAARCPLCARQLVALTMTGLRHEVAKHTTKCEREYSKRIDAKRAAERQGRLF